MTANGTGRPEAIPVAWLGEKARRMIAEAVADRDAALESLREHLRKSQEELALSAVLNKTMRQDMAAANDRALRATGLATVLQKRLGALRETLGHTLIDQDGMRLCAECRLQAPYHTRRCLVGKLMQLTEEATL